MWEQSAGTCDVAWPGIDLADCARILCFFLSAGVTREQTKGYVRLEQEGP